MDVPDSKQYHNDHVYLRPALQRCVWFIVVVWFCNTVEVVNILKRHLLCKNESCISNLTWQMKFNRKNRTRVCVSLLCNPCKHVKNVILSFSRQREKNGHILKFSWFNKGFTFDIYTEVNNKHKYLCLF